MRSLITQILAEDDMDELERTARKHRGEVAAARQERSERANTFAKSTWSRRRRALAGHWGLQTRAIAAVLILAGALLGGVVLFESSSLNPLYRLLPPAVRESGKGAVLFATFGVGAVFCGALFTILYLVFDDCVALLRRAALRRWPGIDCEHYLAQLGEPWKSPVVHVRMVFRAAWPDQARRDAVDAVREWMAAPTHLAWIDDRTLELTTDTLETRFLFVGFGDGNRGGFVQDNRLIHDATTALLQRAARKLAGHAPVERLELEIAGDHYVGDGQSRTPSGNHGWVKVVGGVLAVVGTLASIPLFMAVMDYQYSPQTLLEHIDFSRSDAELAKQLNLPPNDHLHLEFHQLGKHFLVDRVDLTHAVHHGVKTWGFDLKLASSSDDMRARARALGQGQPGSDSQIFDSPNGSLSLDLDHHRVIGRGLVTPEAVNAFWAVALYVIYNSPKPSAAQLDLINQAKPARTFGAKPR